MILTLLAYKPFKDRIEFTFLGEQDLEKVYNQFLTSELCPFFVRNKHCKANEKKTKKNTNRGNEMLTSQDEILEAQLGSSSDEESDPEFEEFCKNIPEKKNRATKTTTKSIF